MKTRESRARSGARSFLAAAAVAVLGGAVYGVINPTFRTFERVRSSITKVEKYGQDVNGDGIATAREGRIDLDGDGEFTLVEAEFFGLEAFLSWGAHEEVAFPKLKIPDSCCVTVTSRNQRYCMLFPPTVGVTCVVDGAGSCQNQ